MKKKKVGLYVLMWRDPQDILNEQKQKPQGIKQCIEYDPLYVNFEKAMHIFTLNIQTGAIFFLEVQERKNNWALSGEKDIRETSVNHSIAFYIVWIF